MTLGPKTLHCLCLALVLTATTVSTGWGVLQIRYRNQSTLQENQRLAKRSRDLDMADRNLKKLKEMLLETQGHMALLNGRIPASDRIGPFLKTLQAMVDQRGVTLSGLVPEPAIDEMRYSRIPIRMIFRGRFADVHRLIHDLETANRMVVMEKLQLVRLPAQQECRVELTASIFKRSEAIVDKLRKLI
ncbi:MAG: type 4a pilus biogenesis protein PilO [Desulfobacterales bacterium]|nr:type 4a pilus biogenesis protein PilO [Desulfobacterales bacterium]